MAAIMDGGTDGSPGGAGLLLSFAATSRDA